MDLKPISREVRIVEEAPVFRESKATTAWSPAREIRASAAAIFILGIVLCGIYPLLVWVIGQVAFPQQANGSLLERNDKIIGSSLIAQSFTGA